MPTNLTLRLEEEVIERAQAYSKRTGKSLSRLVADYFALLPKRPGDETARETPIVSSLRGMLRRRYP
jgi:hypothetical protein